MYYFYIVNEKQNKSFTKRQKYNLKNIKKHENN